MPGASETPDMGQLVGLAGGPVTVSVWLAGNGAMSGACVWFGAALSSRTRLRSVFWLVAVPAAYVAFIMLVPYLTWWVSPWQGKTAIDVWLAAGLVLIVAVVVGSRSDRLHVQP
jgi:hypothetical protein